MQIVFNSVFYPYRGGISQFGEQVLSGLEKKHAVLGLNFTRQYPDFLFPGKSQYDENLFEKSHTLRVIDSVNPFSWIKAAKIINQTAPDYLISAYWMSFFAPAFGSIANLSRVKKKKIALIHNLIPHEKRLADKFLTPYFVRSQDVFVVMSENVRDDVKKLTSKPVFLRPHPIYEHFGEKKDKNEARKRLGISPEKKVILFFGLIRPYKGLSLLLEAFEKLSTEYVLLIAGECYENIEKYLTLIEKNPNCERIIFHRHYIPDTEVGEYFCASDVNVLPYLHATQSGVTAVACHFEVPMIVCDVGNLGAEIRAYHSGLTVNSNSPEEMSIVIQEFFEKRNPAEFISGIQNFKKENNWEKFADFLTNI
jgi:glycosyltransferase involved in cell wall biosynthesis